MLRTYGAVKAEYFGSELLNIQLYFHEHIRVDPWTANHVLENVF